MSNKNVVPDLVSIIIPSANEIFLSKTIEDILNKAQGNIEIIAVLDGYWPEDQKREHWETKGIIVDDRVNYIYHGKKMGMRPSINHGVAVSNGQYLLKCDAHVMFDEGFDVKLKKYYTEDDWVMIPRRKRLEPEEWKLQDVGKPDIDYEFLSYPFWKDEEPGIHGTIWTDRIIERKDKKEYMIDNDPSFQGSCWFMKRSYYDYLDLMDDKTWGSFANEAQEIGFKAYMSGGKVKINKHTWYAHLHKGKTYGRGYFISKGTFAKGRQRCMEWITNPKWEKARYSFSDMINMFMPMPTWPENWKEEMKKKGYQVK